MPGSPGVRDKRDGSGHCISALETSRVRAGGCGICTAPMGLPPDPLLWFPGLSGSWGASDFAILVELSYVDEP